MNEKDKWSVHVEYLKLAIALSTALIAAGAAIYVDSTKIPTDWSRYVFLAAAGAIFMTLLFSLLSIAEISNHLIYSPVAQPAAAPAPATPVAANPTATPTNTRTRRAVTYANLSFLSLAVSVACLAIFFGARTLVHGGPSFERALSSATSASVKLLNGAKGESAAWKSVELGADGYVIVFQVAPTSEQITVQTDVQGGTIKSARR